jgi:hypothetical protein
MSQIRLWYHNKRRWLWEWWKANVSTTTTVTVYLSSYMATINAAYTRNNAWRHWTRISSFIDRKSYTILHLAVLIFCWFLNMFIYVLCVLNNMRSTIIYWNPPYIVMNIHRIIKNNVTVFITFIVKANHRNDCIVIRIKSNPFTVNCSNTGHYL